MNRLLRDAPLIDAPGQLAVDMALVEETRPEPYDEETRKGMEYLWGLRAA